MKKIFLSVSFVIIFAAYVIYSQFSHKNPVTVPSNDTNDTNKNNTQSTTTDSIYTDGAYIGDSVDTYFGNVQVKAIITNGGISDIQFLIFPNDRATSIKISNESLPKLRTEAIAAQNANIDIVSGATQTSDGFKQSLLTALTRAHK